jgi:hypothetical protein
MRQTMIPKPPGCRLEPCLLRPNLIYTLVLLARTCTFLNNTRTEHAAWT